MGPDEGANDGPHGATVGLDDGAIEGLNDVGLYVGAAEGLDGADVGPDDG